MKFNKNKVFNVISLVFAPLLPFIILLVPYSFVNHVLLNVWLGCGGANIFTIVFWVLVCGTSLLITYFMSKKIINSKVILKILYVAIMLVVIVVLTYLMCLINMWK